MNKITLILFLSLIPVLANADAVEIDGIYYNLLVNTKQAEVTSNPNKYTGSVKIPEFVTYDGTKYDVTTISDYAFGSCYDLTSISIPNGVKYIGVRAFEFCYELSFVNIPPTVEKIGEYAFQNATTINISDLSAWCNTTINDGNFCYPHQLYLNDAEIKELVIPEDVTTIRNRIFSYCSNLLSVTMSKNVNEISDSAFYKCENIKSVVLGNGIQEIRSYTFYGCKNLESLNIPNTVLSIGKSSFSGCTCLKNLIIPNSVKTIGNSAFLGCSNIADLKISPNLTEIGAGAFAGCDGLTTLYIPSNVSEIGYEAFSGCNGLTSIIVDNGNMKYDSRYNCNAIIETETNTLIVGCNASTIPYSVQTIGLGAFSGCKALTTIIIPNTVTLINSHAFSGSGLTTIEIPNSVTHIPYAAFQNCTNLSTVKIPNNVVYIDQESFQGCSSLSSITIPNGVTHIGAFAFSGCTGLKSISIPSSVTFIGEWAFEGCRSLPTVTLPSNIKEIKNYTFSGCVNLETIIIPKNITIIGYGFGGIGALSDVYCFAEDVPQLDSRIFVLSLDKPRTLHVPANAIEKYKRASFWSDYASIVPLTEEELSTYGILQEDIEPNNTIEGVYLTQSDSYRIYNGNEVAYDMSNEIQIIDNGDGTYYVDDLVGGWYSKRAGYGSNYAIYGEIKITPDGTVSLNDSYVIGWDDGLVGLTGFYDKATSNFTIEAEYIDGMIFFQKWVKTDKEFEKGFKIDGINYRISKNKTTVSVANGFYSGDIKIPEHVSFNGITYSVTSIDAAFRGCKGLTSVVIPNSITNIGSNAFESCIGLTSVKVPNSVTSIGERAFSGCTNLTSVSIPNSVTSIGKFAFSDCI